MTSGAEPFALNHMAAPKLRPAEFFALARNLGIARVEIRNDLAGNAILDGTPAASVREEAQRAGVEILSINALQRFNDWSEARASEAEELADYAAGAGARALVLVPRNDGEGRGDEERLPRLIEALAALKPILLERRLTGFVEPLGFEICSLRLKSEAVAAIDAVDGAQTFKLVHDTFHHHLAGEAALFPDRTGLVHISGVDDASVAVGEMRDSHRGLVGADDRLGNVAQIEALRAGGYAGALSFEPFAESIQQMDAKQVQARLAASMALITAGLVS
ncbi:TIM barrel protein [Labrys sp. ZIDIC5]|uniref:TIM barrel protein n=1 Tax=Labrys sedimenti TaxID=3106036 RepID=UPI002ACA94D3|nr:TIM barrel protein [Labrys sp. ZIDIC5]MDZ5447999.1 TIM barrel protein [Labrys sp. ZIDIC5]